MILVKHHKQSELHFFPFVATEMKANPFVAASLV